jgi:hypothetical protein
MQNSKKKIEAALCWSGRGVVHCSCSVRLGAAMSVGAVALAAALWAQTSLPRFVGYAYKDVNASASHNIVLMVTVSAAPYTGHDEKKKGWIPPDPHNATLALVNTTMALPPGRRAIRAIDLYHNGTSSHGIMYGHKL